MDDEREKNYGLGDGKVFVSDNQGDKFPCTPASTSSRIPQTATFSHRPHGVFKVM